MRWALERGPVGQSLEFDMTPVGEKPKTATQRYMNRMMAT
jgi:hypothetical protein